MKIFKGKEFYISGNDISDGWHTFKELYEYRMIYNALWLNTLVEHGLAARYKIHKSYRHYSGELCFDDGWFIVAAELPTGVISNHYKNENWDLFKIPSVEKSIIEYDGHTPEDVKNRMLYFLKEKSNENN